MSPKKPQSGSSKKRKSPRARRSRTKSDFFTDMSVSNPDSDELNFLPFATQLATTIALRKDPLPLIFGIYGEWGSGKTTVLNFLKDSLDRHEHVICFHFNPWLFSDQTALIRVFFMTLAAELDRHLRTGKQAVGNALEKLGWAREGGQTLCRRTSRKRQKGSFGSMEENQRKITRRLSRGLSTRGSLA
jgi:predicted KAP-like P-loop ATPase